MAVEMTIPEVTWLKRAIAEGQTDYDWVAESSTDIFKDRRVVIFALPGAFTPTCSSTHLPGYESNYESILEQDVDEVYCLSVNDSFVMNAWFSSLGINDVKPIADGNGNFTRQMGMLVDKDNVGFGMRSWRYAMVVNNGVIEKFFEEPGRSDNFGEDPYGETSPETVMAYLKSI